MGNEHGGEEAEEAYGDGQYPGTFFQDVRCLLDTHQLIAEPAYVTGKTAAFGVLYQDDKA